MGVEPTSKKNFLNNSTSIVHSLYLLRKERMNRLFLKFSENNSIDFWSEKPEIDLSRMFLSFGAIENYPKEFPLKGNSLA